jgi:methylmalonyl-CoA mutase C-terminal domain/subunit
MKQRREQMASKKSRIIVGKLGLDSHDNGLRIISRWLMDSGYEVVYAGLYNTTKRIVQMALQEDADAIGISFLGGEHLYYAEDLLRELKKRDMGDKKVVIGGVIPPGDVDRLKSLGVDAVFTPGTRRDVILENIHSLFV